MKIITVLGTRPEIVKLSPLIDLLEKDSFFEHKIIHTGQHYDFNMDGIFFEELNLPKPAYSLNIGSHIQGKQTGLMLEKIEEIFILEKPDMVIVLGDTNTTLAGALAASKLHLLLMHVEAGCRSFNKNMPEEINRIIVDHIADALIAPDEKSIQNLVSEGISPRKIFMLGSTTFDVVSRNKKLIDIRARVTSNSPAFPKNDYILVTIHRAENTDNLVIFAEIMEALNEIADKLNKITGREHIIFPVHPRTRKIIETNNLNRSDKINYRNPESYFSFLNLLSNCRFCISDSGGIQEEAAALNVPCLIIRNETEWMRLVEAGKNKLIGTKKESIISEVLGLWDNTPVLEAMRTKQSPFSSDVSKNIMGAIKNLK